MSVQRSDELNLFKRRYCDATETGFGLCMILGLMLGFLAPSSVHASLSMRPQLCQELFVVLGAEYSASVLGDLKRLKAAIDASREAGDLRQAQSLYVPYREALAKVRSLGLNSTEVDNKVGSGRDTSTKSLFTKSDSNRSVTQNARSWRLAASHQDQKIEDVQINPNGSGYLTLGGTRLILRRFERSRASIELTAPQGVKRVLYSPEGSFVLTIHGLQLKIWDAKTFELRSIIDRPANRHGYFNPLQVAISPSGTLIATTEPQRIHLWDSRTGQRLKTLELSFVDLSYKIGELVFSPDESKLVFSKVESKDFCLWNLNTGEYLQNFDYGYHAGPLGFSPSGLFLFSRSEKNELKIWDTQTWKVLRQIRGVLPDTPILWSPRAPGLVVTGLNEVEILDPRTRAPLQVIHAYGGLDKRWTPVFDRMGLYLATKDESGEVSIWNTETGHLAGSIEAQESPIKSLQFSPDSNTILTLHESGSVRVWQREMLGRKP